MATFSNYSLPTNRTKTATITLKTKTMDKLISMTGFVLNEMKNRFYSQKSTADSLEVINNYANFLLQKLELWMFVPCKLVGSVWVVLEKPTYPKGYSFNKMKGKIPEIKEYEEAKERVLFEGFVPCITNRVQSAHHENCSVHFQLINGDTIESISKCNITLTQIAKKQIGL